MKGIRIGGHSAQEQDSAVACKSKTVRLLVYKICREQCDNSSAPTYVMYDALNGIICVSNVVQH